MGIHGRAGLREGQFHWMEIGRGGSIEFMCAALDTNIYCSTLRKTSGRIEIHRSSGIVLRAATMTKRHSSIIRLREVEWPMPLWNCPVIRRDDCQRHVLHLTWMLVMAPPLSSRNIFTQSRYFLGLRCNFLTASERLRARCQLGVRADFSGILNWTTWRNEFQIS